MNSLCPPRLLTRRLLSVPLLLACPCLLSGLGASAQSSQGLDATQAAPREVSGTVINAVTRQPIPRALVKLGSRSTLAGTDGHFVFAAPEETTLSITAVKPGYRFAQMPNEPGVLTLTADQLAAPITLPLYPEALLKGTITGPAGEPLADVGINLLRLRSETWGERWVSVAQTRTNVHGQFRSPVPAGDYRIQSSYSLRPGGTEAVLPATVPPPSVSSAGPSIPLRPGEQETYDLHPSVAALTDATLRTPGLDRISQLELVPPAGVPFTVPVSAASDAPGKEGEAHVRLPVGSYTLQVRQYGSDDIAQAEVTLTGAGATPPLINLHTVSMATLPIQILVDSTSPSGTSAAAQTTPPQPPGPRSLGLVLTPTQTAALTDPSVVLRPMLRPGRSPGEGPSSSIFFAAPGTYRLHAQSTYSWYIRSATYGGTDLLSNDLLAASGTGSTPILLTVSNAFASLAGNVTLRGQPARCWIYLLATFPSATPMILLNSRPDGRFLSSSLPPGTYRAIAFQSRQQVNPDDTRALETQTTHITTVTLQAAQQSSLTLEAVSDGEPGP